ncbi:MAG: hypothetical protein K0R55_2603 [Sporomusa sp.]|jgi:hypothetical protein|nr:hypothetical protein [Sporomusa sp.]
MLNFWTKRYIGVDISDSHVRTADTAGNVVIDETVANFVMKNNIEYDTTLSLWTNVNTVLKIMNCIVRKTRSLLGLHFVLAVPSENYAETQQTLLETTVGKMGNLKTLILVDNIIAAAVSASSEDSKIMGPDEVSKKLYVFSQSTHTYISLFWAGSLVDFKKIPKGYNDLENNDLVSGIKGLIYGLPIDVPSQFLENNKMKPFLKEWNKPLDRKVFISIPSFKHSSLGSQIGELDVTYTRYSDHLVLEGLVRIVKLYT